MTQMGAIAFIARALVLEMVGVLRRWGSRDAHAMLNMLTHTGEKARDIYPQPWHRLVKEPYAPMTQIDAALRWLQQR